MKKKRGYSTRLPPISGYDLIKYLMKNGYIITKIKGSHHFMKNGEKETIVPAHDILKKGTLMGRLKDLDIPREKFIEEISEL